MAIVLKIRARRMDRLVHRQMAWAHRLMAWVRHPMAWGHHRQAWGRRQGALAVPADEVAQAGRVVLVAATMARACNSRSTTVGFSAIGPCCGKALRQLTSCRRTLSGSAEARHAVDFNLGVTDNGLGARLDGSWKNVSHMDSGTSAGSLRFARLRRSTCASSLIWPIASRQGLGSRHARVAFGAELVQPPSARDR
jgi:hypothetical protein